MSAEQLSTAPQPVQEQAALDPANFPDLVRADAIGRPMHLEGEQNGKQMSQSEFDQIASHADQIRDGVGDFANAAEKVAHDEAAAKAEQRNNALDSLGELMENGATLDGPTLSGKGLRHEQIMGLGFNNLDEMKSAASDRLAQKARQAAADERTAKGAAQAEAWKQELDTSRESKAAGKARVEAISYKKKIEGFGEAGLKTDADRAKLADAAKEQAEAEGYEVEKPRHYEVVTNPAAEQRAKEMAELLKNRPLTSEAAAEAESDAEAQRVIDWYKDWLNKNADSPVAVGSVKGVAAELAQTDAEDQAAVQPEANATNLKDMEDQDEAARIRANMKAATDEHLAGKGEKQSRFGRGKRAAENAPTVDEDGTVTRSRGSIKGILAGVGTKLKNFKRETILFVSGAGREQKGGLTEKEKRNARIAIVGTAAGALALSLFLHKHGSDSSHLAGLNDMPQAGGSKANGPSILQEIADQANQAQQTIDGGHLDQVKHAHDSVTLKSGENPWTDISGILGKNASVEQIDHVKDLTLKMNDISEAQAYHLPVGTELKLPVEEIEKIRQANGN